MALAHGTGAGTRLLLRRGNHVAGGFRGCLSISVFVAGLDFLLGRLNDLLRVVEARVDDPRHVGMRLDVYIAETLGLFTRSQAKSAS